MAKSGRVLIVMLVLVVVVLLVCALPWLKNAGYVAQLFAMPAPVSLPVPVVGVGPKGLANTWQAPRAPGRRHEGIDIFAKKGTPILSSTEGLILKIGQNPLGGNVVWVLGPGGQRHYYAHLDTFAVLAEGQRIKAGRQLGTVGNTGNAKTTPPHLHYGVYAPASAINPYPLLTAPAAARPAAPAAPR